MLRKWTEQENAVNFIISIDRIDRLDQFFFCHVLRKNDLLDRHAKGIRALCRPALIAEIIRALPAANDRKRRNDTFCFQCFAVRDDPRIEFLIDFFSKQQSCHMPSPPFLCEKSGFDRFKDAVRNRAILFQHSEATSIHLFCKLAIL